MNTHTALGLQAAGGTVPESAREDLLEEVLHLVESPTVVAGTFSETFLDLPEPVLVTVMRKHQRYFPAYSADSSTLTNTFVFVANGAIDVDTVRVGNEAVLRARFQDAEFFYAEDLKSPLETFLPKLKGTVFQRALGSMYDKAQRSRALVPAVAKELSLEDAAAAAEQAVVLGKADLATAVVMEMTSLAGVMGKHYAERQGLDQVRSCVPCAPRDASLLFFLGKADLATAMVMEMTSLAGVMGKHYAERQGLDQVRCRASVCLACWFSLAFAALRCAGPRPGALPRPSVLFWLFFSRFCCSALCRASTRCAAAAPLCALLAQVCNLAGFVCLRCAG